MWSRRTFNNKLALSLMATTTSWPKLISQPGIMMRTIPSSGEKIPAVGLGTWIQFDVEASSSEANELTEVLKEMAKLGGTVIDSSPMYGRSEATVGTLAERAGIQDSFFYATKVWTTGKQSGIDQMNSSMQKMKRKSMDLMQIHNLQDWETHLQTLRNWKSEGKIRYVGLTHYTNSSHDRLARIIRDEPDIDFIQCNLSINNRHAEQDLLNVASDQGVAVIVNTPYEGGSLFRKIKGKELPAWSAEWEIKSWGQYFLKYIISHPSITCVIPGTSNPRHVIDNMMAGYGPIPDKQSRMKMVEYFNSL